MPIAFDASVSGPAGGGGPHTTALATTGTDIVVVSGVLTNGDGIPTVTYQGNALTALGTRQLVTSGYYIQLWARAIGAGVGSQNMVVTAGTGNTDMYPVHASYTGCAQSGIPDAVAAGAGNGTTMTPALTTIADLCWLIAYTWASGASPTAGANTLLRRANNAGAMVLFDSNAARSVGSNSLNVDNNVSTNYGWMVISLAPISGILPAIMRHHRARMEG